VDRLARGGPRKRGKRVKGAASQSSGEAATLHRFIMVNGGKVGSFTAFDHQIGSIYNPMTCVIGD
jgi:hypothetical protein